MRIGEFQDLLRNVFAVRKQNQECQDTSSDGVRKVGLVAAPEKDGQRDDG
jgi:hypothetical protein